MFSLGSIPGLSVICAWVSYCFLSLHYHTDNDNAVVGDLTPEFDLKREEESKDTYQTVEQLKKSAEPRLALQIKKNKKRFISLYSRYYGSTLVSDTLDARKGVRLQEMVISERSQTQYS